MPSWDENGNPITEWDEQGNPVTGTIKVPSQPSALSGIAAAAEKYIPNPLDVAIGATKGIGSTLYNTTNLINKGIRMIPGAADYVPSMPPKPSLLSPEGTMQKAGFTGEQIGEFFVPGSAEEAIAAKAPAALKTAAKIAASGLGSGAVNAMQGGSFGTGAAVGAGGAAMGALAEKVAPSVAESALNISRKYRMYGKTPGKAMLEETTGLLPGTISDQAASKALALTSQLENLASQSTAPTSVAPAVQVVDNAISKATAENTPGIASKLGMIRDQLTHDLFANPPAPLPVQRSATDILNLKRGIGKTVASWSVDERKAVEAVKMQVYHALDSELDAAVPGADALNQRISSLIGVKTRGAATAEGAKIAQRVANRFARATGALASGVAGGYAGYREGGIPGAAAGSAIGLVAPEVIASPATQILAARGLNKASLLAPAAAGAGLQLDRENNPFAP